MKITLATSFLTVPLAHRALHDRARGIIENSPSAIKAAIDAGYGIEIDVQLSKDCVAMVFHDDRMDRLTDKHGLVRDFTAKELSQITLKDSVDTIPTLNDVLKVVAGQAPLLIELKDQSLTLGDLDGRLERSVADSLRSYTGDVAVMSFNPKSMRHMQNFAPQIARGLTTCDFAQNDWPMCNGDKLRKLAEFTDYNEVAASFISHDRNDLDNPQLAKINDPILTWTIKSKEQESGARKIAANITFEGYLADFP